MNYKPLDALNIYFKSKNEESTINVTCNCEGYQTEKWFFPSKKAIDKALDRSMA